MKKLLGISLVAVLAATPLMAGAADLTPEQLAHGDIVAANGTNLGDAGKMATVSYVKGAYTELGTAINTKQDQITAGGSEVSTSVVQAAAMSGKTVATASDTALMSEKAVLTAIGTTDGAMNTRVATLEGQMGNAELTDALDATTVTAAVNELSSEKVDQADNFTDGSNSNLIKNKTVVAAIQGTAAQVDLNTTAISTETGRATGVEGALDNLNEGLSKTNLVSAINSENTRAKQAENDLQTAINTLSGAANTTYAKKVGVTQTISDSTISGTVPVVTDWANQTAGTVAINATITGAEYAEPTDEPATDEPIAG